MPNGSRLNRWRMRRLVLPAVGIGLIAAGAWAGFSRSAAARLIVYNETGTTLPEVTLAAGQESASFRGLAAGDSVRLRLHRTDEPREITVATNGAVIWRDSTVAGGRGARWMVRLRADGATDAVVIESCWQRLQAAVAGAEE